MPPWLPDTADRAFAGSKRAAGLLSASDGCAGRVPDHFLYPTPPTTKMAMVPVTQSHFGSLRFCWAAACCEVSSTASLVGDSDGLRAQCWPAFHRGGRRSDRRSFKYMSFMCILIIIHIHSLCHALAFLANQRVTTGVLCKRSVKGEKMNIHLEKKLLEVMREIATEDADFIRNADHEALVSLAQGNTMLYSVSLMKEVLDTFTAEHNRLAEHVLAERGYDGDGHPVDHKKSLEACQAARRIRL